jgi:serine protease inhibitor ecotin
MTHIKLCQRMLFFLSAVCLALAAMPLYAQDAADTIGADPEITIEFHVIGFATDQSATEQLQQVAQASGGQYYDAQDQQGLEEALSEGVGIASTGTVSAEIEPNDIFGKANTIRATGSVSGAITPQRDVDWYALDVNHHGRLEVTVTDVPAELDIVFRVWNSNRDVTHGWFSPLSMGGDTVGVANLAAPGRYYLEVRDGNDDAESVSPYSLRTVFTPAADTFEPNDRFGSATPVEPDTVLVANILPQGDVDWYCTEVDHQGELQVAISNVPEDMDITFRVWNANRDVYAGWFYPLAPGGNTEAFVDLPAPGRYCLEVRDNNDNASSIQPYTMETVFTPAPDALEPNNTFGAAALVDIDSSFYANILPQGDVDWYAFDAPHQGELRILVTEVPENMDITYRVWDANRDVYAGWYNPLAPGGDTEAIVDLPSAGRYFLEVRDAGDNARAIEPYLLNLSFTPAMDIFEPNQTFGSAAVIAVDGSIKANILPKGDVDWYAFDVPHHGELQLSVTDVPQAMDIAFRVWTANRDVYDGWFRPLAPGGDTNAIVDLPEPGRYYIELRDNNNDARSIEPYTLSSKFMPAPDANEPNNESSQATPLIAGEPVLGNILPRGDVDWYRIEALGADELSVVISEVPPELDINFRVRDEESKVIGGWFAPLAPGGNTEAIINLPGAGTYFIEVQDGRNDARSIQPYVITASLSDARNP